MARKGKTMMTSEEYESELKEKAYTSIRQAYGHIERYAEWLEKTGGETPESVEKICDCIRKAEEVFYSLNK